MTTRPLACVEFGALTFIVGALSFLTTLLILDRL